MNKQEFLDALRRELSALPADELEDAIRYYDEYMSEAGAQGDVTALMGSPQKVAEDFKKEYYDKKPPVGGELTAKGAYDQTRQTERKKSPVWLYAVLVILIIGFGVPIARNVLHRLPGAVCLLVILALIVLIIKALRDKNSSNRGAAPADAETCSDIRSVNAMLGAGKYVIRSGDSFSIDGNGIESYIRGGVWNINAEQSAEIVTVTLPEGFTADELFVTLGSGSLLLRGLSSYSARISVGAGRADAENVFTRKAEIRCGTGKVKAELGVNGNVDLKCGAGLIDVKLKNPQSDFNVHASAGAGSVIIGGKTASCSAKIDENKGAFHNINADCGMGEIKVTFA